MAMVLLLATRPVAFCNGGLEVRSWWHKGHSHLYEAQIWLLCRPGSLTLTSATTPETPWKCTQGPWILWFSARLARTTPVRTSNSAKLPMNYWRNCRRRKVIAKYKIIKWWR